MPYLRDHTFFEVPAGWPDPYDGFPVVPATELIRQMMAAAETAGAGQIAVAVHEAQFKRWLCVEPPVDVTFQTTVLSATRVKVDVIGYAEAVIELAPGYPPRRPEPWDRPPGRAPLLTGRQMYEQRWMFHGPSYQGVAEIDGIGERHVHGTLVTPDAPGGLLDSAGHLISYWTLETIERDSRLFPVGFGSIRFFSAPPPPGERLTCLVRITDVTATEVIGAAQLVRTDTTPWAQVENWRMHRFASDDRIRAVERAAGTALLAETHHAGWYFVREAWPDLASRELMARSYLTGQEWADYERRPPRDRRSWLLGRIALKDAVRAALLDQGRGAAFPAEVTIHEVDGRPQPAGRHGLNVPELAVATAHGPGLGVALARPGTEKVGIAVIEVSERDLTRPRSAAHRLLAGREDPVWLARLDAATQAARQTGHTLAEVTALDANSAQVRTADTILSVGLALLPGQGSQHVIAWTKGQAANGKDTPWTPAAPYSTRSSP